MGTRKWLFTIIVDNRCTLCYEYVVYEPKRSTTEIVCELKRLFTFVYDMEKYDRIRFVC